MSEKNRNEKFAERWFDQHGFEWKLIKQYLSKTVYEISKDGLTYKWEMPFGVTEPKKYMELACGHNHDLMLQIEALKSSM